MIYAPKRFLFLHVPRTGGMSITTALLSLANECDLICNTSVGRHSTIHQVAEVYGKAVYDTPFIFCVTRPAAEIRDSTMRLIRRDLTDGKLSQPLDERWRAVLEHAQACGGQIDRGSNVYQMLFGWLDRNPEAPHQSFIGKRSAFVADFHDLSTGWQVIRDRIGYESLPVSLPRLNGASP